MVPNSRFHLVAALALCLLPTAPALAEPRPGQVAGLDLATPQAAAASFVEGWQAGDFFVVYYALDPVLREKFSRNLIMYDIRAILGDAAEEAGVLRGFSDSYQLRMTEAIALDRDLRFSGDNMANFVGLMTTAADLRALPFALPADGLTDATLGPPDDRLVRLALPAGVVTAIILRKSDQGRWRVLALEGGAVPEMWRLPDGQ